MTKQVVGWYKKNVLLDENKGCIGGLWCGW